jgi:hypothetical protein
VVREVPEKPVLRIIGYEKEFFLKIETQVFQIEFVSKQKSYMFCRRFGDFVTLDKLLRQQYPGFILYPIPENNLEFFKRIKLSVGAEREKVVIIEHRLLELEKYLSFLLNHQELAQSQVLEIFICESPDIFAKQFRYLEDVLRREEEQFVETHYGQIRNYVKSGLSYLSSYVSSGSPRG